MGMYGILDRIELNIIHYLMNRGAEILTLLLDSGLGSQKGYSGFDSPEILLDSTFWKGYIGTIGGA